MYISIKDWGNERVLESIGVEYIFGTIGIWHVINEKLFFLSVIKYGIEYVEVDRFDFLSTNDLLTR